ncbi:MAG: 5-formyltetrahydrofolate cyclo-ligase [Campylobacterota bacterium]
MDKKKIFRLSSIQRLQKAQYKPGLSKKVAQKLQKIIVQKRAKTVLFYLPLAFEPNLVTLMNRLRKNRVILVPFMQGVSFKTVQYRLPLEKKRFGIKEPRDSNKYNKKIDIAVVPVVGVDGSFKRVGFGKGMYDRFFDNLSYRPYTVFVQTKDCITRGKITDFYDIKADLFITANNSYLEGFKSVYRDSYGGGSGRSKCRCKPLYNKKQ